MLAGKIGYFRATGFDPRSIGGLAAWYDASEASTLFDATSGGSLVASNGAVARWEDRSGNGFHLGQATLANRPLRIAGEINGRDVLRFDGTNDFIERSTTSANMTGSVFSVTSGASMFMVLRRASNNNRGAHGTRSNSATNHHPFNTAYFDSFASSDRKTWTQAYNPNLHLYEVVASPTAWTAFQSGGQLFTTSSITLTALRQISFPDNGIVAAMDLCEAVCYSRAVTAQERMSLEQYFASKWGFSVAPVVSNADAQDWISRVYANGGTVSTTTANAVNTFCNAIDAAGIRDRFYRLNLFAGTGLAAALVPLYRGQSLGGTQFGNATDTNANFVAGDYVETGATGGLLGNGSTKWLNTGLPLNFNTNRHIGVVLQNSGQAGSYLLGAWGASGNASILGIFTESNLSLSGFNFSDAAASGSAGFNAPTLRRSAILSSTPGAGGLQMFINGSAGSTGTAYSTSNTGPISIFGLRRSNAATPEFITSARLSAYTIGDSLNATQAAALNTALTAFSTAMSRA